MKTRTNIRVQKRKIRFDDIGDPYQIIQGERVTVRRILGRGDQNAKTIKNKLETKGFSGAPHILSGHQQCGWHSDGCAQSCLGELGLASVHSSILAHRIVRSAFLAQYPDQFCDRLNGELEKFDFKMKRTDSIGAVRLDMFTDRKQIWLNKVKFSQFQNLRFYDYTKSPFVGELTPNYRVTFSLSETNKAEALRYLAASRCNVAIAFYDSKIRAVGNRSKLQKLPKEWNGYPVIDGDKTDFRFDDQQPGYIVGLRLKANSYATRDQAIESGFAIKWR